MTEIIYVDSSNRASGTASNFSWKLRNVVRGAELSTVRVDGVRLVNSFRTIEPSNCLIYIREPNGRVGWANLEVGYYSATELTAHLAYALGSAFRVEYISWSNSLRISRGTPFHFMTDAELARIPPESWPGPGGTSPSKPCSFNGVLRNPDGAMITDNSFTTLFLNVSRYNEVYLCCPQLTSSTIHGCFHGRHDVLARIDVDTAPGTILKGASPKDAAACCGDFAHKHFDFVLVDNKGAEVELHDDSLVFTLLIE